jgi:hypothetical protein
VGTYRRGSCHFYGASLNSPPNRLPSSPLLSPLFLHCALFGFLLCHAMEGDELTNHSIDIRKIVAHGMTEINVVYTDDSYEASKTVHMYEQWLSTDEYKFMGLDFEYCDPEYEDDCHIAVVQLAMKNHVLVYQWSRYIYRFDFFIRAQKPSINLVLLLKYENLLLCTI